jgi:hypothetical protein
VVLCCGGVLRVLGGTTSAAAAEDDSVGDPGRAGVAMGGVERALLRRKWWRLLWLSVRVSDGVFERLDVQTVASFLCSVSYSSKNVWM